MPFDIIPFNMDLVMESNSSVINEGCVLQLNKVYKVDDEYIRFFNRKPSGAWLKINETNYRIDFNHSNPTLSGFIVKRAAAAPHPDPVINKWGDSYGCDLTRKDGALRAWLLDRLNDTNVNLEGGVDAVLGFDCYKRFQLFNPMQSLIAFGKVSVYQTRKDHDNDRQVAMKPGRAFKLMVPELTDEQVYEWVDKFRDAFASREYTLHISKDADDFVKAYTGNQVTTQNIDYSCMHKSLANSCMRYHFKDGSGPENLPVHPVSAYASGDFTVAWVEDSKGLIGGRVVVYTGCDEPVAAPIYGACNSAITMLEEYIESIGADMDTSWAGAKLKAIPYGDCEPQQFIAPYLDVEPRSLIALKDHLVVDCSGDLDANSYQGLLCTGGDVCYNCECRVDEHELMFSEYTETSLCSDCFHEHHFFCEYTQDYAHDSEAITVWSLSNHGPIQELAHESVLSSGEVVECSNDQNWSIDEAAFCDHDGCWISPTDIEVDYFWSDWDGELYPNSEICTVEGGDIVAKDELKNDDKEWKFNESTMVWVLVEEKEEE